MERFLTFLRSITRDERTIIYAILLTLPLAFVDCWYLSPSFPKTGLFSQIALALGVDLILVAGGIVLDVVYVCWVLKQSFKKLYVATILFASIIETVLVVFHIIAVPWQYIALYGLFVLAFIILGFITKRNDIQTIDEQSGDSTNDHEDAETN